MVEFFDYSVFEDIEIVKSLIKNVGFDLNFLKKFEVKRLAEPEFYLPFLYESIKRKHITLDKHPAKNEVLSQKEGNWFCTVQGYTK